MAGGEEHVGIGFEFVVGRHVREARRGKSNLSARAKPGFNVAPLRRPTILAA